MTIRVKVKSQRPIKVKTQISVPENLTGIDNVNIDNIRDGYILMYNDENQRYEFVDPDKVLSKAVTDNFLPPDFVEQLDTDLDNKINLDAGEF